MTDVRGIGRRPRAASYPMAAGPITGEASAGGAARAQGAYATLVSLFLLLLVFFVLLVSVSRVEAEKLAAVAASLDRALAGLPSRLGWTAPPLPKASEIDDPDRTAPAIVLRDVAALVTGFAPAATPPETASADAGAAEAMVAATAGDLDGDHARAVVELATDPLVQFDGSPGIWFAPMTACRMAGGRWRRDWRLFCKGGRMPLMPTIFG